MLYNNNKQLRFLIGILLIGMSLIVSSCKYTTKMLDSNAGLSQHLGQIELSIRSEDWVKAKENFKESKSAWEHVRPVLQLDIDHDYIKNIDDDFVRLDAYLETKDKSNSLASILLIRNEWENIDSF